MSHGIASGLMVACGLAGAPIALLGTRLGAETAVRNPGFETGALAPWHQDREEGAVRDWGVGTHDPRSLYRNLGHGQIGPVEGGR